MKNLQQFSFLILGCVCMLMAFKTVKLGAITGKINPPDGAKQVYILKDKDTLKAILTNGFFKFSNLKQGVYNVQIIANEPYRNTLIENVAVKDSSTTNIGEIKLLQ
jgi:ABC-type uncharacterized transport system ATPase subunit